MIAVNTVFGDDVDYAMLHKIYGADPAGEKRYSPAQCIGAQKRKITGNPEAKHVSTSYAERANLTMRMHKWIRCEAVVWLYERSRNAQLHALA